MLVIKQIIRKLCSVTGLMFRSNDFHSPRSFEYTSPILNLQRPSETMGGIHSDIN